MQKNILTLILLIIFIISTILNIKMYIEVKNNKDYLLEQLELEKTMQEQITKYYDETVLEEVTNTNTFFKLKFCVEKYFSTILNLYQNEENISKEAENELLNIIAEDYKDENDLTVNNIKEKFTYFEQEKTIISKAYQYNIREGISMYLLNGYNICNDGSNKKDFQIMLITDTNQNTFEVYPEDYLIKHKFNELKLGSKVEILNSIEQIEKKDGNEIEKQIITNETIAQDYFDLYIFNMRYDTEVAYNMLNKEYKEKRFPTMQDFTKYIENRGEIYEEELNDDSEFENIDEYMLYIDSQQKKLELAGYQTKYEDDYTRYICVDNYNNYYMFYVTTPLKYTVMLDTYTIDTTDFIEKYNTATTEEKVGYNIQKIVEALNSRDYSYIYSKLANEFKANYFKTYEDFEEYAKKTFNVGYEVEFDKYTESNNLCTYQITLTRQKSSKTLTKTIVMRLEEGTDFVMSFNVE